MSTSVPHVVFAGGGTGGHLFPGLAVAETLRQWLPSIRVTFVGSGKWFEERQVAAAGFAYRAIACRPAPRRPWHVPSFLVHHVLGLATARRLLRREGVDLVVGLGGYASVPVARAASGCGVRLVLLEQNVEPGRATRWLARRADAVYVAFEETAGRLPRGTHVHVTGTPLRSGFERAQRGDASRLLVLGGSQGAASLNQSVPRALYQVRRHLAGWEIVHQAGDGAVEATRTLYGKFGLAPLVVPFVRNMPRVLSRTDLVVSRCGGSTLAELAAVGVPAVLVPYPRATADHQRTNAELFRRRGGCPLVDERDVDGRLDEALAEALEKLLADAPRRARISHTVSRLGRPEATRAVAELVRGLLAAAGYVAHAPSIDGKPPVAYHRLPWEREVHQQPTARWRSAEAVPSMSPPASGRT
ncbi:MAG: undecaprenyldiphospho-muramoylpentapeptide beta-N-acetylglucosaminyltransferase [Pirellulales bacterium]|nr:undecaprenyldiphospho-muramoylpentapeptide beta-N-acetylglucosaminyltransferase [Pirellulales bacterium]